MANAYLRAAHQLLDARPHILEDPIAVALLGEGALQKTLDAVTQYQALGGDHLRAHTVLRSRYAEDRLSASLERGVGQYVILGAGYDTFAYRQPAWARSLRIFEMDRPELLRKKQAFLAAAGLEAPPNLTCVPMVLGEQAGLERLLQRHLSLVQPAFFSWLGVMMYLDEATIDETFRAIAAFPRGTEVVFTYLPRSFGDDALLSLLAQRVAAAGEPFVSCFGPEELERKLLRLGFAQVEFLSSREAEQRYFAPGRRDLPVPAWTGIGTAIR